ncbi:ankyrin-3-like isoform X2 [Acanthaster planci]|uniref:Ankyrin-3-like isoform X2 n=1 Tax=Acanthaster planci TaxID=133434 RepID=A0A8B8A2A1_ACAPL|nr:ankyrin-3-like isoform X2 [Acanthaster planci]
MCSAARFAVRFGPVKLLQALLNDKLIDINHTFDDGRSLLHIACLSSNAKVVAFLITHGASLKALDNAGRTPDQLCFCPHTRKELPSRYQTTLRMHKKQEASFTEKEKIFQLSADSESFEDLQMMLHTLEFNVNRDRDPVGNLLLHRAVQRGMSHLTLIMNLVLVHHADVEAVNNKGMTPLCIAAHLGYGIIAEALICILGADPNTCCSLNHWTPLHFAAKKNNTSVTEWLSWSDTCNTQPLIDSLFAGISHLNPSYWSNICQA